VEFIPAQSGQPEYAILYAKGKKIKVDMSNGTMSDIKNRIDHEMERMGLSPNSAVLSRN